MYTVLLSWLSQKDKMFQVLGPIATEPRMVESQTQQVQVLQDEFGSQQPFLVRFRTIGESVLSRIDSDTVNSKQLRQQTTTILNQWESLSVQLTERQKCLDAAGGITREFHVSITKLQENLQKISDEFDATVEGSTDPDDQLKKLISLEDRLESTRHLLADVESICEQLCEILSDSASKTDIKNKMNSLEKHYSTILKKINNRKAELESALKEDKKFFVSCNNIQKWLNEKEDHLSRECRVSAEQNILKQQVQEFEPIYKDVLDKEHEVHLLLSKGTDVVAKISRKPDALQLRSKLEGIKMQWEKIRKIATDRHTRLQICSDNCKKFHCALESFLPWLEANEKKLSSLQHLSFHRTELDKQIREIQTFKNDISKHSQEYDNIRNLGDTLVSCCDSDKEPVKDKMAHLKKRWDRLNQDITTRSHTLDVISQRLTEYYEKVRDIQHSLQRLDDKLASHDALGDAAREPRHLERMKSFLAEADDVHRQLITLKDYVKTLLVEGTTTSHIAHINKEVDTLEKRHEVMSKKLRSQLSDLEKASEIISSFTSKVKAVQANLNTCEEDLDKMGTIGRDLNTVRAQYAEVKNFIQELTKIREDLKTIDKVYQKIATQGYNVDSKTCKDQVSNLQRQINRLDERSKTYVADIEKTLKRLEQFYNNYGSVIKDLETVVNKERSFKPIGGDVETVRTQQEQFKVLYKQQIEPLKKQIEEVNKTGQGLIQSASSGVNTTGLEHDLEKLNEKWNELKERLNDRERRLDVALLQSGKFQEALAGVQKWLQDTEEMVDNQKAPSADYKVVKAQVQEQKFLKKLLLDRQNSICSLETLGTNIMEGVEQTESSELTTQLSSLIQRFDQLTTGAEERMKCLGNTIPVARDFQEKLTVLIEWVEVIERKIVTLSTVPTDTDRIKMHLVEHQAIGKDIANHRKSMDELEQLSVTLRNLVGEEEIHVVNERLQEIIDRFETVSKDTQVIGHILDNVSVGLGKFTVKYQTVNSWIEKTLARISPD